MKFGRNTNRDVHGLSPGADAALANEANQAHSISRLIAVMVR
jgi:hypothetical protein